MGNKVEHDQIIIKEISIIFKLLCEIYNVMKLN